MFRTAWQVNLAAALMSAAVILYLVNFLVFQDAQFMLKLLLAQLGFLPISVLLVTLVINQLLVRREKLARMSKLNMVIGAFFSEVGVELLRFFAAFDEHADSLSLELGGGRAWAPEMFTDLRRMAADHRPAIDLTWGDLPGLRQFLKEKRPFLLRLLENPCIFEHESFSQLMLAIFHLSEELFHRQELGHLSQNDRAHLAADLERGYILLISEWLAYLEYLDREYPYLFSLAVRLNPFNPQAGAAIR
jgi:hypothetical protein